MSEGERRVCYLSTYDLHRLDQAGRLFKRAFDEYPYLVGSVNERGDYRDVDVRLMLSDEAFDALFPADRRQLWSLLCYALTGWLRADTGLPIDFQIQRQTEANALYGDRFRNPLGVGRDFAGLGDANNLDAVRTARRAVENHSMAASMKCAQDTVADGSKCEHGWTAAEIYVGKKRDPKYAGGPVVDLPADAQAAKGGEQ